MISPANAGHHDVHLFLSTHDMSMKEVHDNKHQTPKRDHKLSVGKKAQTVPTKAMTLDTMIRI